MRQMQQMQGTRTEQFLRKKSRRKNGNPTDARRPI